MHELTLPFLPSERCLPVEPSRAGPTYGTHRFPCHVMCRRSFILYCIAEELCESSTGDIKYWSGGTPEPELLSCLAGAKPSHDFVAPLEPNEQQSRSVKVRFVIANIIDNYHTSGSEMRGKAGKQVPARGMCSRVPVHERTAHSTTACEVDNHAGSASWPAA